MNFQMFKLDLEKAEEPEIKLPTSKKKRVPEKKVYFCFIDYTKPLTVWITANCGKFWKRWEYQTTWPASWKIYLQVKKQQLELDIKQHTGSKSGKEYVKAVYCHPAYLTYIMWNVRLDESQAGIKIAGRKISNLRYADDTNLMSEGEEDLKSLLMKMKEEKQKAREKGKDTPNWMQSSWE